MSSEFPIVLVVEQHQAEIEQSVALLEGVNATIESCKDASDVFTKSVFIFFNFRTGRFYKNVIFKGRKLLRPRQKLVILGAFSRKNRNFQNLSSGPRDFMPFWPFS